MCHEDPWPASISFAARPGEIPGRVASATIGATNVLGGVPELDTGFNRATLKSRLERG
jgi:hypothetical protein